MELKDTVEGMLSKSYEDRFVAELEQVYIRMNKLGDMLAEWDRGELEFEPKSPKVIYDLQLKVMQAYFGVLVSRAEVEGIKYNLEA